MVTPAAVRVNPVGLKETQLPLRFTDNGWAVKVLSNVPPPTRASVKARVQLPSVSRKEIQPTLDALLQVAKVSVGLALGQTETNTCDLMASTRADARVASRSLALLVRREFSRKRLKFGAANPTMTAAMASTTIS